jgi:hypothetical protein
MPVSNACTCVACSVNAGGGRWIGYLLALSIGPFSSTGRPTTFMMRPSVASPTGTVMPSPVSMTSMPRTRPSETSIEMVRTVFSPRCCATSRTRFQGSSLMAGFETLSALKIAGRLPSGKWTSTAGPMTWMIRPLLGMGVVNLSGLLRPRRSPSARS